MSDLAWKLPPVSWASLIPHLNKLTNKQLTTSQSPQRLSSYTTALDFASTTKTHHPPELAFASTRKTPHPSERQNIIDLLKDCTNLSHGKHIHAYTRTSHLSHDTFIGNLIICMYARNDALHDARSVFDHMPHRNVVTWNSMIGAYSKRLLYVEAFHVFHQMLQLAMDPDQVTFLSLLCACGSPSALSHGSIIHACILGTDCKCDVVMNNALVNMYGKCGALDTARSIFDSMHYKSTISWNSMIARYNDHGKGREALKVYKEMRQLGAQPCKKTFISALGACIVLRDLTEGRNIHADILEHGFESDVMLATTIIDFYGKCACLLDAWLAFGKVQDHDVALWTAILSAHFQQGEGAFDLGTEPDQVSLMGVCEFSASLEQGIIIHAEILERGLDFDIEIGNALLNLYGKCGTLMDACIVFKKMTQHDIISWNALLAAYSQYGMVEKVTFLIHEMEELKVRPDEITYVCLLSACSRTGLVEEAELAFSSMVEEQGIVPEMEHYNCMVDVLGRAGHVQEAEMVIRKIPFRCDKQVWVTLLGACNLLGDSIRGEQVAEFAVRLSPHNTSAHVLLSNIYAMQ